MLQQAIARVRIREEVLGVPIDVLTWAEALDCILAWAGRRESRTVCICNVHSVVTARENPGHARALRSADMVTPDGAPVAWMLRRKAHYGQERISGPDLMLACCRRAVEIGVKVFLYGGTETTLCRLEGRLREAFPGLAIAGAYSPPFRVLTPLEDTAVVNMINDSGAGIVWVGLGCPKQETWMDDHRGRVQAVMAGVGAAFDFHAGVVKRAPLWMQRYGWEWAHRLAQDPRRLAGRYIAGNGVFVSAVVLDFLSSKRHARAR